MLNGLNHISLAVRDLEKSLAFYGSLLGFTPQIRWARGAYLALGSLWLCLSVDESRPGEDYSHIAFSIAAEAFDEFAGRIEEAGIIQWKTNCSEGDSLYILDPDGHKLEIHVGNLDTRLQHLKEKPYDGLEWLQKS
jgi:catechol 2,3-dioxygenase-like lactoylglutathione lyase family enzyme